MSRDFGVLRKIGIKKFSTYFKKRRVRISRNKKTLDHSQEASREQFRYLAKKGLGIPVYTL